MDWKLLSLILTTLLEISYGLSDSENLTHVLDGIERQERSTRIRRQVSLCDETTILAAGEKTLIYSDNNGASEKCSWKIQAPEGSTLSIDCPSFFLNLKGCGKDKLTIKETGEKNAKFCKESEPINFQSTTNSLNIAYNRKELKGTQCSGGFICEVFVS